MDTFLAGGSVSGECRDKARVKGYICANYDGVEKRYSIAPSAEGMISCYFKSPHPRSTFVG